MSGGELSSLLATARGGLDFLGRRSDAAALRREAAALTAGLAREGLAPGDRLALFLPNVPTLLVALFAAAGGGLRLLLLDPREPEEALQAQLRQRPPRLLLTQNPAPLFDKALELLRACPEDTRMAVGRFTDLLPFPRNLLAPFLRGGGLAALPPDPRFLGYADLLRGAPPAAPSSRSTGALVLELRQETLEEAALQRWVEAAAPVPRAGERWLIAAPLARRELLAASLRGLRDGAELLLSPRLDAATLDKVARHGGAARRIE